MSKPQAAAAAGGAGMAAAGLVSELDTVGWERLAWLQEDMRALTLTATDSGGRRHELSVKLPPGYPAVAPAVLCDLPAPFK